MKRIELHIIQNFAPSCLNRDDTNAPKDCMFGGTRRARISSQCIKRAVRLHAKASQNLNAKDFGYRSKRIRGKIIDSLVKKENDFEKAKQVATTLLLTQGIVEDDNNVQSNNNEDAIIEDNDAFDYKTQYLLFIGGEELDQVTDVCLENWNNIKEITVPKLGDKKKNKAKARSLFGKKTTKQIDTIFEQGKNAPDIALFGRMVADAHNINVDAACQVAHAISTHKIDMEMDFFTAIDDLQPEDNSGADMMGTVEFNSACFYRYAVIDWDQLTCNLNDEEVARKTVEAFIHASVEAIPSGKQNTFAAHNPPSFVFATVRTGAPWSLANAFEIPVRTNGEGYSGKSIIALAEYWKKLAKFYPNDNPELKAWLCLDDKLSKEIEDLGEKKASPDELVRAVLGTLS